MRKESKIHRSIDCIAIKDSQDSNLIFPHGSIRWRWGELRWGGADGERDMPEPLTDGIAAMCRETQLAKKPKNKQTLTP